MAKPIETLSIQLKFKDAGSQAVIEKLRGSLKRLQVGASGVRPNIKGLRNDIIAQGNASVKTVSNINAQIAALRGLRDEAKIGGKAFQQLTKDIDGLNAKLGKAQGQGAGRGMGARRATQAAGAVISGGIFGGPEGALGALGGLAVGGVEGAYAGAAIGAAVGGGRQALSETAAYAAEVNKLKIALEGVTGPGEDFQSALSAAADATRDLNVPQQVAVKGITRLAAAVTGAKGPVSDAELTFKNVTAAIKATGGSSEDVQGAITAMVQVFSKGKVSAEELSGQLGERLPGAVTMFAEANDMTLPELQKNLKAGTVGLNELMNFIVELGNEFDGTAKKIASSNEEAGARLQVAFNEMRLGVGRALVGTGADLQNAFTQFIQVTTPSVINATKQIVKNIDLVVAALGTFAAVVGGAKLIGAIKLLTLTLAANPLFAGAAIAAGVVTGIVAINNALNGTARELEAITKAGAKPGATGAEKALAISTLRQQIADQQNIIDRGATGQGGKARYDKAVARKSLLERRLKDVTAVRPAPKPTSERDFKYKPITPDGDSGAASKAEALARQQEALYQRLKPQLTQTNQLLNEGNKFEQLRIKERFKAVALIKQIKEGVKEANQQELIDLVELNEEEAIRNINLEERKQKLEEMFSMDFAGLFEPQQNKIQEFISGAENSLKDLQQVAVNISQGIGNAVANSLVNGIQGLVDGSAKAKDVFADLLRSVGQVLSQEGAKMIATYISIGIAKIFAGFGQPKFGELGSFEMGTGLTGFASQTSPSGFNPGALFGGKASGGPVNAGRPYVVGERGPELFVPGQNGGVMRNEEMRQLMGRSPAGANGSAASMNFTFETTNIGGTEYVSREQLESAMATTRRQAANDGAKRGMNMTLDKMQNSPRTRSRIGIS